jgi:hypothetical protein
MKQRRVFALFAVILVAWPASASAATTEGMIGDGLTSIHYDANSGEMRIQPDGMPVGLFDIQSTAGIFVFIGQYPPGGCGNCPEPGTWTANRRAWAALPASAISSDFSFGTMANAGLLKPFLLSDLTLIGQLIAVAMATVSSFSRRRRDIGVRNCGGYVG